MPGTEAELAEAARRAAARGAAPFRLRYGCRTDPGGHSGGCPGSAGGRALPMLSSL